MDQEYIEDFSVLSKENTKIIESKDKDTCKLMINGGGPYYFPVRPVEKNGLYIINNEPVRYITNGDTVVFDVLTKLYPEFEDDSYMYYFSHRNIGWSRFYDPYNKPKPLKSFQFYSKRNCVILRFVEGGGLALSYPDKIIQNIVDEV
jgi:hypothetical protein